MELEDFLGVAGIISAASVVLGWWIKSRLEGSISHEYAKIIDLFKTKNQLRLSALNERLRAHQEAYQLWRELNSHLGTEEIQSVVAKCDKWWGEKCLYLEPEAREAFLKAWATARILEHLSQSLVTDAHKTINDAGAVIERSVALPPLNELEIIKKA